MKVDPKTGRFVRLHAIIEVTCACGKNFTTTQDRIDVGRGKTCSKACMYKNRNARTGQKHHFWKEKPKYSAIHKWVAAKLGQPFECENCEKTGSNPYAFHWANISGQYKRDLSDWARLCARCHWHFDREGILICS